MANKDHQFPFTKGRMTPSLIESMLIRLLANPTLFHESKGILKVEHFNESEIVFSAIWAAALYCDETHGAVTFDMMIDKVSEFLLDSGDELSPQEHATIFDTDRGQPGLLYWALEMVEATAVELDHGRELSRRFLEERAVMDPLRTAIEMASGGVPSNLPDIIERANKQRERINSIQEDPVELGIPDEWVAEALDLHPTGISFFDEYMDGGHAPGEVNGILGPFGVGKTTVAVQLAVEQCRYWHDRELELGEDGGQVYFFTYEQRASEIRKKAISYAAHIHMDTMNVFTNEDTLSRRGNLKPYEIEGNRRGSDRDMNPPGEYERYLDIKEMLKARLRIVDLSGCSRKRMGDGYVDEIAAVLEDQVVRHGSKPRCVIVDHVWLAAYRHLQAQNLDERKLRHFITMFGDATKLRVAERFSTPVWLLHQYNGDANKANPGKLLHHTQAAESSSFAMPLSYVFCIGVKDKNSNTAQMVCTKSRRSAGEALARILLIRGEFSEVVDRTDSYVVHHDKILRKDLAAQFGGEVANERSDSRRIPKTRGLDGAGIYGAD